MVYKGWRGGEGSSKGYKKNCMCLRYLHVAETRMVNGGRFSELVAGRKWTQCACLSLPAYSLILRRIRPHVAKSFSSYIISIP